MKTVSITLDTLWRSLLAVCCLLLPSACADDAEEQLQGDALQVLGVTRAGDADPSVADGTRIRTYITTAEGGTSDGSFIYSSSGNTWTPLTVKEHAQYYLYGYMPGTLSAVLTAPEGETFENGADLKLTGLDVITTDDVCVVTGVQRVESATAPMKRIEEIEGQYGYFSGISSKNFVYLVMDHVYAAFELHYNIAEDYAKYRSIHLKEVELTATYGRKVDVTVSLRAGSGVNDLDFTVTEPGTITWDILTASEAEVELPTYPATVKAGPMFFCPQRLFDTENVEGGTYLSLKSTYDVYDRKGNNLGERVSVNKLVVPGMENGHGVKRQFELTVTPTYLYILSDGDLDNPTIKVKQSN